MTIFDHPIWPFVSPYVHMASGRDNVDILGLPDDIRNLAVDVVCNCVSCNKLIKPFRVRAKSTRSRIAGAPEERRLFYAATCPAETDPGCSRTKAAKNHKEIVRRQLAGDRAPETRLTVEFRGEDGVVLGSHASAIGRREVLTIPVGTATVVLVPAGSR